MYFIILTLYIKNRFQINLLFVYPPRFPDLCLMIKHSYSSSDFILGYNESKIRSSETADCVVRSFASALKITYDVAHEFVRVKFNRKNRQGTSRYVPIMNGFAQSKLDLFGKTLKRMGNGNSKNSMTYADKGRVRNMTTFQFIKQNPKGVFMVTVRGHAFTICNGAIMGNHEDVLKTKRVILHAWEVV